MNHDREKGSVGVEASANVAASGLGLIVGTAAGGPVGTLLGAAAGPPILRYFRNILGELSLRNLGQRQEARVESAWIAALEDIAERLNAGETPRSEYGAQGSTAEDILEQMSVITATQADTRLAAPLGHLYASILFEVEPDHGRYLVVLAEKLSYLDLQCLSAAVWGPQWRGNAFAQERTKLGNPKLAPGVSYSLALTQRIEGSLQALSALGLVGIADPKNSSRVSKPEVLWQDSKTSSVWSSSPDRIRATKLGEELAERMRLEKLRVAMDPSFLDSLWPTPYFLRDPGKQEMA